MRIASVVACLVLSVGCRSEREHPWSRYDLTFERPASGRARARLVPLGPERVASVNPRRRVGVPVVRGLEQRVGERSSWEIELGVDAFFRFRPMPVTSEPCACRYRVLLETPDETTVLARLAVPGVELANGLAPVIVDLAAHRGSVRLILELEGSAAEGSAVWASPSIYHRAAVPDEGHGPEAGSGSRRPDVVLIAVDTLRADYLGLYGAPDGASPNLDRLARTSDVWLEAFSTANATNPSFASIMTGLYPRRHGVVDLSTPLDLSFETMAELFSRAGYDTAAVVSARHLGAPKIQMTQGFDHVLLSPPDSTFSGEHAVEQAMSLISERGPSPYFLWVHLFDPHTPHLYPEPFGSGRRAVDTWTLRPPRSREPSPLSADEQRTLGRSAFSRSSYARGVAFADHQVGRLLAFLDSRGGLDSTIVAFVADHGEQLGEHGNFIGHQGLHETVTHVPLMIHWPGQREGRRITGLVQSFDLFPTLLRAAGIAAPGSTDALDLRELGEEGRGVVFAQASNRFGTMIRTSSHKLIRFVGDPTWGSGDYLYDLHRDIGETTNLADRGLEVESLLGADLERFAPSSGEVASPIALSREEREALEALGYVP